ncbi:right-handed parallel beta-helix repeat-containing protein, partial [Paraburkholderia sp. RL18-103-BIB-C]
MSPSGSDSNDGTSASTPFQTLTQAQKAMEASASIKTTYLMGGTYSLSSTLTLEDKDSGQSWLAYPGQIPILDGGNKVSPGIAITGNRGTSKVSVRGITLRNTAGDGIDIWNTSSDIVDSNTLYNIGANAIVLMGHDTSITISHNLIYAIAQHAIQGGNDSVGNDPFASSLHNILIDSNYIHDVNTQPE